MIKKYAPCRKLAYEVWRSFNNIMQNSLKDKYYQRKTGRAVKIEGSILQEE